jgi:hypothetical protein
MPAKSKWLLQIPIIRSMLAEITLPVVDRAMIQSLFGLGRRQAIEMMHRFGGYQAGRTFLIERTRLIAGLDAISSGREYEQETARREKLTTVLQQFHEEQRARGVRINVAPEAFEARMSMLPATVRLQPGKLEIAFSGTEDLLTQLFTLARVAANDYAAFCQASAGRDAQVPCCSVRSLANKIA